jgi:hypothetical protein
VAFSSVIVNDLARGKEGIKRGEMVASDGHIPRSKPRDLRTHVRTVVSRAVGRVAGGRTNSVPNCRSDLLLGSDTTKY